MLFVCHFGLANESGTGQVSNEAYVGVEVCQGCHADEYQRWRKSDHQKAMQNADPKSVLGDFSDITVNFHGIKSHFYRDGDRFYVDTSDDDGESKTFKVRYTFGYFPLQQYLIETDNGHIQALNVAWDSRDKGEGGQRWFHLQPDENITPDHPFFWANHFQNWNSRCADCHSTNVERNYNSEKHSYKTTWSEINVACEACHGPGGTHSLLAKNDKLSADNTGFTITSHKPLKWQFENADPIANPIGKKNSDNIDMCGSCHSLRTPLTKKSRGQGFHDNNRLQLLSDASYFADGQIREEVFVLGSFLQSKMFEQGVTCSNCHDPHSGNVRVEGNGLCTQCHTPVTYDTEKHHHHGDDSEGSLCVNCHMPAKTFMQVDARRDHSFTIPRPALSSELDVPNACTTCHEDGPANDAESAGSPVKDNAWAARILNSWNVQTDSPQGDKHWSRLNHRAQQGDILVTRELVKAIEQQPLADLIRASMLQQLSAIPSRVGAESAQLNLQDKSPLVRRAAVIALQGLAPSMRWQILSPYLQDASRSVRFQLADALADVLIQLPVNQRAGLAKLIAEYRESLQLSIDAPATQVAIANLEIQLGNIDAAIVAFRQALRIEPYYVPALINLADYFRSSGAESEVRPLLEKALSFAPDSGAVQHSYGLFLIRNKNYEAALEHLDIALKQVDAQPRYAYVYAVALENQGRIEEAVKTLKAATTRWPNQYELLMTLVIYLEKTGDTSGLYPYLSALTAIAPSAPDVRRLVSKYAR